jgi:diaminopropionate ammonia-lyase
MAGLACGDPSPIAWQILIEAADYFISAPDYIAAKGMRVYAVPLREDPFIVSGESGAVTLSILMEIMENPELLTLKEKLKLNKESQVLLINTEGNTDPINFRKIVWEGFDPIPF